MEANLPDELHGWVSKVIEQTRTGEEALLTYDPTARRFKIPSYEVQAAALIIVTMKLLFKLDDKVEWKLSNKADEQNSKNQAVKTFCLQKWYETVHCALDLAREREEQDRARQTWKPKTALYPSKKDKTVVIKRRRVVEQLQMTFQKLSGSTVEPQRSSPSSFRFQWGEEGTDGPSFHNHRLGCVLKKKSSSPQLSNVKYWHTALKVCDSWHDGTHFQEVEPTLPRTYMWLLGLFSFLLGVKAARVHAEVCHVERRLIKGTPFTGHKTVSPRRKKKKNSRCNLKRKKVSLTKTSTV
ncbi:hypothetical protein AGOR_G00082590 [Albula goreensis]|uniref:Rrn7/TAF1B C-terminal cyclin domain-containing protein n=1 Tax=Albula goreensis TaxID=1534307 RepID=A0A8T3DR27_9TELE|nr:hypothetical protein AGOR_G00082590 [Albula goreensis]